jgi:hypothetical protein
VSTVGDSWYATNRSRHYPLAEVATGVANSGQKLPEGFLADLHIKYPDNVVDRPYIRFAAAGRVYSLSIAIGSIGEIAVATADFKDAELEKPVELIGILPGVTGYVIFGECEDGSWVFDSPQQSQLSLRVCTPTILPSGQLLLSRHGFPHMTGPSLRLVGQGDVEVTRGRAYIDEQDREVVFVGLFDLEDPRVLAEYAGPCGRRPESQTCRDPQPIETINQVQPDCCGRLFIEFRGCADLTSVEDQGGIGIECDVAVADSCPQRQSRLPTPEGLLPGEESEQDTEEGEEDCEDTSSAIPVSGQRFD